VFSAAGHEYTRVGYASEHLVVRVESDLLEREIAARVRRRSSRWLPPSAPIPMTATRRAQLFDFESQMNAAAGAAGSWGQYGNLEALEAAIAGWMAELVLETAGVRSTSELGMARLVRLQRWIDAHIEQDITLDRLCSVAGVGPRSLQKALLAARGQTPHEFLTARRLSAARARLESAALPLRVSAIALDCGFRHFGRFSASYRMAFGESPVETARRAAGFSRKERDSNGA
jgi:AraC-like DNA-binding protein